jgi:uncharacterized OB-fold protein
MSESEKPVTYVSTPVSMRYDYSIGVGMSVFMRAIREGKLLGARCPDTGKVYVPPRLTSVETASPMRELVELPDRGVVYTYCIVNIQFYEQVLDIPYAYAYIVLDGADCAIMHLVQECPVEDMRPGMRVQAVWKDPSEWTESLENIRYFKPTGEPDLPIGTIMEEIRRKSHA